MGHHVWAAWNSGPRDRVVHIPMIAHLIFWGFPWYWDLLIAYFLVFALAVIYGAD